MLLSLAIWVPIAAGLAVLALGGDKRASFSLHLMTTIKSTLRN